MTVAASVPHPRLTLRPRQIPEQMSERVWTFLHQDLIKSDIKLS